jgi:hypothetical protein
MDSIGQGRCCRLRSAASGATTHGAGVDQRDGVEVGTARISCGPDSREYEI